MPSNIVYANLVARFTADTTGLVAGFAQVNGALSGTQANVSKMAATAGAVGRKMTMYLTLPLALIGGAAVKMAMDFEVAMAKAVGLAGLMERDVTRVSDAILKLAGETAQSPVELADAFYYLSSAGLSTKQSLDAIKYAAQAATAGLGEASVISDVLSSAMNAYRKEGLSAYDATNALVGAVKYGKGEAQDFAGALGRVIPLSAQMGISFQETTAAVAGMTQMGLDAFEAVTAMRGIMVQLISPAQQAEETLATVGLSAAILRQEIKDKGLVATLQHLSAAFGGNEEAIASIFPEVRGLVGMLNLTGQNAANTEKIVRKLTGETDFLGAAFNKMASTDAFQMKQAMSELQVAMIGLGQALLPIVVKIVQFGKAVGEAFSGLSEPVQQFIGGLLTIVAVVGPVIWITASLVKAFMTLQLAYASLKTTLLTGQLATIVTPIGLVAAAIGGVILLMNTWGEGTKKGIKQTDDWTTAIGGTTTEVAAQSEAMVAAQLKSAGLRDNLVKLGLSYRGVTDAVMGSDKQFARVFKTLQDDGLHYEEGAALLNLRKGFVDAAKGALETAIATETLTKKQRAHLIAVNTAKDGDVNWGAVLADLRAKLESAEGGIDGMNSATGDAITAAEDMTVKIDPLEAALDAAGDAAKRFNRELDYLYGISTSVVEAEIDVREATADFLKTAADPEATLDELRKGALKMKTAFEGMRGVQRAAGETAEAANERFAMQAGSFVLVARNVGAAEEVIRDYYRSLESGALTDETIDLIINAPGAEGARIAIEAILATVQNVRNEPPVVVEFTTSVSAAPVAKAAMEAGTMMPKGAAEAIDLFGGWGPEDPFDRMGLVESERAFEAINAEMLKADMTVSSLAGVATRAAYAFDVLRQDQVAAGVAVEVTNARLATQQGSLVDVMRQAGATDEAIKIYLTTLGLTPTQISTILALPTEQQTTAAVIALQERLNGLHNPVVITITLEDAAVEARLAMISGRMMSIAAMRKIDLFGGWGSGLAHGGVFSMPQTRLIAEAGPEAVVPLGRSSIATADRMRVLAAAGLLPTEGGSSISPAALSAANTSNANSNFYQITVAVAPGGDPAEVGRKTVDAIRAYERRSGTLWRN